VPVAGLPAPASDFGAESGIGRPDYWRSCVLRTLLKLAAGLVAMLALAVLLVLAVNAFDEDLSPDGKALVDVPKAIEPAAGNGYVTMLGSGAPPGEDAFQRGLKALAAFRAQDEPGFVRDAAWEATVKTGHAEHTQKLVWCQPAKAPCLKAAAAHRDLGEQNRSIAGRHAQIRGEPGFAELYVPLALESEFPGYHVLIQGQQLVLLDASLRAAAGDVAGAMDEIDRSIAFHRRVMAGARTILGKMIGSTLLSRDLLLLAEILDADPAAAAAHPERLAAMLRPIDETERSLTEPIRSEYRAQAFVLSKLGREGFDGLGMPKALTPWLFQRNATVNALAVRLRADLAAIGGKGPAAAPASEAEDGLVVKNPVGHWLLTNARPDLHVYRGRTDDLVALVDLVRLQHALLAAGVTTAEAVGAALAGELGRTHTDPRNGQPFVFDATSGTIGFVPSGKGWSADLAQRMQGRVAVRVVR